MLLHDRAGNRIGWRAEPVMRNINEVQKRIKQRPPFQMIEKVLEVEDGEWESNVFP